MSNSAQSQRPSSITTRIKTLCKRTSTPVEIHVRDHLPLQQGLRRYGSKSYSIFTDVRDHLPLQQGLRQMCANTKMKLSVRDHLPLQQGLRQQDLLEFYSSSSQRPSSITTRIKTGNEIAINLEHVRDHLPLQQGLRR